VTLIDRLDLVGETTGGRSSCAATCG
jgi:hypothetical protein